MYVVYIVLLYKQLFDQKYKIYEMFTKQYILRKVSKNKYKLNEFITSALL